MYVSVKINNNYQTYDRFPELYRRLCLGQGKVLLLGRDIDGLCNLTSSLSKSKWED